MKPTAITIAHISDVHLAPLIGFGPRHWNIKRFLGYANWQLKRRKIHLRTVLDRLVDDIKAQGADHIVVTGDLVNLGLPGEYERALAWLRNLGPPERVSVVPGNHDIYARLRTDPGVGRWGAYMKSDSWGSELASGPAPHFPYVRRIGDIAVIGLNSAVITRPGVASGRLGEAQVREAARLLREIGSRQIFRLVLIHHPPLPGQAPPLRALQDASAFRAMLEQEGADLVIHGHNHRDDVAWCPSQTGPIPIVGIASGSLGRVHGHEPLARYNIYSIARSGDGWEVGLHGRGLSQPDGAVVELERRFIKADMQAPTASG